jgi:hypothetical protein
VRVAESQASDSTIMALAGHVSRAIMERYSHTRMAAKRSAVEGFSGADFEPDGHKIGHSFLLRINPKRLIVENKW